MPSGHASHKGTSNKPNVNADGIIGEAGDPASDPDEILLEGATTNTIRTQEFVDNPAALERPDPGASSDEPNNPTTDE